MWWSTAGTECRDLPPYLLGYVALRALPVPPGLRVGGRQGQQGHSDSRSGPYRGENLPFLPRPHNLLEPERAEKSGKSLPPGPLVLANPVPAAWENP